MHTVKKENTGRKLPCDWPPRAPLLWRTHTLRNQNFKLYKLRKPPPHQPGELLKTSEQRRGWTGVVFNDVTQVVAQLGRNSYKHRAGISKDNCPDSRCIVTLPQAAGMLGKTAPQIPKAWGLCPVWAFLCCTSYRLALPRTGVQGLRRWGRLSPAAPAGSLQSGPAPGSIELHLAAPRVLWYSQAVGPTHPAGSWELYQSDDHSGQSAPNLVEWEKAKGRMDWWGVE